MKVVLIIGLPYKYDMAIFTKENDVQKGNSIKKVM
jgi:hypothetical protein